VSECLGMSAREGVRLLGLQGGYVYQSQGGPVLDPAQSELGRSYLVVQGVGGPSRVAYAVFPPVGTIGQPPFYFSEVPEYPWGSFPWFVNALGDRVFFKTGYFGVNRIVQVEGPLSVQEQLAYVIRVRTLGCVDWSVFADRFVVEPGDLEVNVTLGVDDVVVRAVFPVVVTHEASGIQARVSDFGVRVPVRLRHVLEQVGVVLDQDVTDVSFNPHLLVPGGLRVSVARDVLGQDDVISVEDPQSLLGEVPFVFRVARHDRAPALVFIDPAQVDRLICDGTVLSSTSEGLFVDTSSCIGDALAPFAVPFTVPVSAFDPDEDVVQHRFVLAPKTIPPGEYVVSSSDANVGKLEVRVEVWDGVPGSVGVLSDWQDVVLPVKFGSRVN